MRRMKLPTCGPPETKSIFSSSSKNGLYRLRDAIETGHLSLQLAAPFRSEAIEAHLAIGFRNSPLGFDPSLHQHLLQGGIEQSLFHRQHLTGKKMVPLSNGV